MAAPFEIEPVPAKQLHVVQGIDVPGQGPVQFPYQKLHIEPYSRPITGEYIAGRTVAIADYALPQDTLSAYDTNGFCQFPTDLSMGREEALAMGDELEQIIWELNMNVQWGKDKGEKGKVLARERPEMLSDLVMDWVHDPRFLVPAAMLVRGNPVWHHGKAFIKPKGEGGNFPAHRDDDFYPHETDQLVAETLNLSDVTLREGPVRAYPGTHRRTDLAPSLGLPEDPHFPSADWPDTWPDHWSEDQRRSHTFAGDAGTRSAHNGRVIHRSAANEGERDRRTLIVQLRSEDNKPDLKRVRPEFLATGGVNHKRYPEEGRRLARLS